MNEISVSDLSRLSAPTIVDVREGFEYTTAHVPDVLHIPLGELVERTADIPDADTVYVICASGGRSSQATAYLSTLGINAVNVIGGTLAWQQAGLATSAGTTP